MTSPTDPWLELARALPGAATAAPRALFDALRARAGCELEDPAARARLLPPALQDAGDWLVDAHVEREAVRALLRLRWRPDAALCAAREELLAPEAAAALAAGAPARAGWREVHPRLFAGQPLSPGACARLLSECDRAVAWLAAQGLPPVAPNSMNRYGLVLADLGLSPLLDWLLARVLRPAAAELYADLGGARLAGHHAFLVDYGEGRDRALDFHVDESDVTLNLCLGERFEGGELYFAGLRCDRHLQSGTLPGEAFTWAHAPGTALLHAGRQRHGAHPLRAGRRANLVLWCRQEPPAPPPDACPPWCGAFSPRAPG